MHKNIKYKTCLNTTSIKNDLRYTNVEPAALSNSLINYFGFTKYNIFRSIVFSLFYLEKKIVKSVYPFK